MLWYYFKFKNLDPYIKFGVGEDKLDRETFAFIIVGIDILGVFILLISLKVISRSQKISEEIFKDEIVNISDFTLQFKNMQFNSEKIS